VVKPCDLIIHLGDVAIGNRRSVKDILADLPGRIALVLGNHDRQHGPDWWMDQGFAWACQGMVYRNCWLTHEPSNSLPGGCDINIHGHLHNFTHDVHPNYKAKPFHRLLAIEYTNYYPVNFQKFVAHPDKYKAMIHHKPLGEVPCQSGS
jgi:calcineurin-like phosphoesterase family protein